jgi:hypothetical protein
MLYAPIFPTTESSDLKYWCTKEVESLFFAVFIDSYNIAVDTLVEGEMWWALYKEALPLFLPRTLSDSNKMSPERDGTW